MNQHFSQSEADLNKLQTVMREKLRALEDKKEIKSYQFVIKMTDECQFSDLLSKNILKMLRRL